MNNTQELFKSFSDTVLLVGNGTIQNKGTLIDSYPTVVRFNDFVIAGYEKHIGTKIDAIGFASADLFLELTQHLLPTYNKYIGTVPIFCFNKGSNEYTGRMLLLADNTSLFSPSTFFGRDPDISLSTGVCTALSLALFFNKEVHLVGFDFMKSGHYWQADHIHSTQHVGSFEEQLLRKIPAIKLL